MAGTQAAAPAAWSAIQRRTSSPGPPITAAGTAQISKPATPSVPTPRSSPDASTSTPGLDPPVRLRAWADGAPVPEPGSAAPDAGPAAAWLDEGRGDSDPAGLPVGVGLGEFGRPIVGSGGVGVGSGVVNGRLGMGTGSPGVAVGRGVGNGIDGSGRVGMGTGRPGVAVGPGVGAGVGVGVGVGATMFRLTVVVPDQTAPSHTR